MTLERTATLRGRRALSAGLAAATFMLAAACQNAPPAEKAPEAAPAAVPEAQSFHVELRTSATLPSGSGAFALELTGELGLRVVERKGDRVELAATLDGAKMKLGGADDAEAQRITQELARPALFVLENGRVEDAWYSHGASGVTVSSWRTVMGTVQRSAGPGNRFEAQEHDSSGRYHAVYTLAPDGTVTRAKTQYVSLLDARTSGDAVPASMAPKIESSETRYVLSGGRVESAELKERVVTRVDERTPLTVETSLALRSRPAAGARAAFDRASFLASAIRLPPTAPAPSQRDSAQFDRLRTEGWTFPKLLDALEQQGPSNQVPQWAKDAKGLPSGAPVEPSSKVGRALGERTGSFGALIGFFRIEPGTVDQAVAKIRAKSPASDLLISGLSSARTPATEAALVTLVRDPSLATAVRHRAMVGLPNERGNQPASVEALRALVTDSALGEQALMSLGSIARMLHKVGRSEEGRAIAPDLSRGLARSSTPATRAQALRAISNSGDASLLEVVRPLLEAPEPEVRGAAAAALRHMRGPEVTAALASRLTSEASGDAMVAVVQAAETHGPTPELVAALVRAITSGPTPGARRRAVDLGKRWVHQHPSLQAPLDAAARDPALDPRKGSPKAP